MAIFSVHQPPLRKYEDSPDPERFAFVRDGFSFWAFLLGPLWMLRHRMWIVLAGYVAVVVVLQLALRFTGVPGGVRFFVAIMLALLVGLEAGTLRRFTFGRRKWKNVGVIAGDNREAAERRFFDSWVQDSWVDGGETLPPRTAVQAAPARPTAPPSNPSPAPDVIGLFPEPGARR